MHIRTCLLFQAFLLLLPLSAETILSGNIGGEAFTPDGNPYVIKDNVVIKEGKTTTIKAGCVFLFRPFSGLVVNGSLIVEGTLQAPVVFTSAFDNVYAKNAEQSPNPFDWNGILISPEAGNVSFSNIVLAYSVYGIKSQKDALLLNNATFTNNGQFHFTIGEKIQQVTDGVLYTYRPDTKKNANENTAVTIEKKEETEWDKTETKAVDKEETKQWEAEKEETGETEAEPEKKEKSAFRKAAPVIFAITGLASGAATAYFVKKIGRDGSAYQQEFDPAIQKQLKRNYWYSLAGGIALGGITAICLPTAIILIVKDSMGQTKPAQVSILPHIGYDMGITMAVAF